MLEATITPEIAARLLGVTTKELAALVKKGIITAPENDQYQHAVIVRQYIQHIKAPQYGTQAQIGAYLDMSDRNVREVGPKIGLTSDKNTLDEWRIGYIRHLREQAAGRSANGDIDLATNRALLAREQTIRLELQNAIARKEYAPVEAMEHGLADLMAKVAAQMDTIRPKLKVASDKLTAEDLDRVDVVLASVRNEIANLEINWFDEKTEADEMADQ